MDLVQFITSAFTDKAREIEEVQAKINAITQDYNDNLKLTAQRDEAIRQLKSTLSQEEKRAKSIKISEQRADEKLKNYYEREKAIQDEFDLLLQQEQAQISSREQKKNEYESILEEFNRKKREADEQTAKNVAEHEKKKNELSKKFEYAQKQIITLRDIALQMKSQAVNALDYVLNDFSSKSSIQKSKNDQLEKQNDVLIDKLNEKQSAAQKEIKDLQKKFNNELKTLRTQEKEKKDMFEQNKLYCETQISERTKKLNTYQSTFQSITEQRQGREEVIEQLRIRFEDSQNLGEETIIKLREKQKSQKSKIKKGKQCIVALQQQEEELKNAIESQKNNACLQDKSLKKLQRKLLNFKNKLDAYHKEEKENTITAAKNLTESEETLQQFAQDAEKFETRLKNAREEMKRQYNEEKRVHESNCAIKENIVQLEELIAKTKAMIPAIPKISALVVSPATKDEQSISIVEEQPKVIKPLDESSTFDVNQISDLTDLSFSDEIKVGKGNDSMLEKEADLQNIKEIVEQFNQELETEKAIVAELKQSPQLLELREKNEMLKKKTKELVDMNREIAEMNKRKKSHL